MRKLFYIFDLEIIVALFAFVFCVTIGHWSNPEYRAKTGSGSQPKSQINKDSIYRTYKFSDHRSKKHKLQYKILKKHVQESEQKYGYFKEDIYTFVVSGVQKFNKKNANKVKVDLQKDLQRYKYRYSSKNSHLKNEVNAVIQNAIGKYCNDHMILHVPERRPDYKKIQKWQAEFVISLYEKLKGLARKNKMKEREFIAFIARFVQCLKYKIPQDPKQKEILGFWPPVICLKEKAGDCDSKSTLFASLFYHYRKKACIMIITKAHAFIGIKNQHKLYPRDKVIKIGGIDYLLLETTNVWRLGGMSKDMLKLLKKGQYQYVAFY